MKASLAVMRMSDMVDRDIASRAITRCGLCEEGEAHLTREVHHFTYGTGADAVELSALVPVWSCAACGDQVMGEEAEDIIHEVVCRHLGRLTPQEIRDLRGSYGLRQEDLGALTGYGTASIKRWEAGSQIPSESADKHLRLVRSLGPAEARKRTQAPPEPRFRTEISASVRESARAFHLRSAEARRPMELAA